METSLLYITEKLLSKNKISFDRSELSLQIQSHPSYPSLHAITGVLEHFDIENMALDVPQNEAVYKELPENFIAQVKLNDTDELVFVSKKKEVQLILPDKSKKILTKSQFIANWTGIVVVVDKDETAETNPVKNNRILKLGTIALLALMLIFTVLSSETMNYYSIAMLAMSLIGTYVGFLLVKHELGIHSEIVEKLCTSSKKTNCGAVLNSKGATLFGLFKLSDVSFVYFITLSLAWLNYLVANNSNYNALEFINLTAFPVIIYSVYYQAIVIKKWCPLCLATASVLACQSLLTYTTNGLSLNFSISDFFIFAISSLTVIGLYSFIKPLIITKLKLTKNEIEFYKFKRKYSLFSALFNQSKRLNTTLPNLPEITFGNPNAKIKLLTITNPLCGFCKATHQAVDRLLKTNSDELLVTIRFNINTKDSENTAYKIATALLNLYTIDKIACLEALHQIYTDKVDVDAWLNTYNKYVTNSQFNVLDTSYSWCVDNNINFTPAVYLNDREYPKEYQLSDLNLFTENIIEENEMLTNNLVKI